MRLAVELHVLMKLLCSGRYAVTDPRDPPIVQFSSFLCSFQRKLTKKLGWHTHCAL